MYEVHGWFGLAESTEEADVGGLTPAVERLRRWIADHELPSFAVSLDVLNGQPFLVITGNPNRPRETARFLGEVLELICRELPGSWGMLYERDDELVEWPGSNAFKATVMARGQLTSRGDPFLSPCNPTIED